MHNLATPGVQATGTNGFVTSGVNNANGQMAITGQQRAAIAAQQGAAASGQQVPLANGLTQKQLIQNGLMALGGNNELSTLLQQRLGLSSNQISQIDQLQAAYNKELTQLQGQLQTNPQGTVNQMVQAGQQLQQQIDSILTAQQRQVFAQLTGIPNTPAANMLANNIASGLPNTGTNSLLNSGNLQNAGTASTNIGNSSLNAQNNLLNQNSTLNANGSLSPNGSLNASGSLSANGSLNENGALNGNNSLNSANNFSSNSAPLGQGGSVSLAVSNAAANHPTPPAIPAQTLATANAKLGSQPFRLGNGGFLAINNPGVQQALQMTPGQLSQLEAMQSNYIQELGELSGRFQTDPQGTLGLYNNALQQSTQQIESVLTPQQRQLFSRLTGLPNIFATGDAMQTPTTNQ